MCLKTPNNILSIDVEECFHGVYTRGYYENNAKYRSPDNIPIVLRLLREYHATATFFIVGEILERFPELLDMIEGEGHEVAFHGWSHLPLWKLNKESFRKEIVNFKQICPNCKGYRAPSFSLNDNTKWAWQILEEMGFTYDSSIFPAWTPLYGMPDAPTRPYKPSSNDLRSESFNGKVWEFPLTVYSLFGFRIPSAGGFYLRCAPWLIPKAINKTNEAGLPAVIYIHNWELDPLNPKFKLGLYSSFVTYYNLKNTVKQFECLLRDFRFTNFTTFIKDSGML
jgi:polysaccharide deacetylase family protein (PEP-CTERM system associated)